MSNFSIMFGRILLGLYFLLPGLAKAAAPTQTIAYMESHGILFAPALMWFSVIVNIIGGLLLITGRHVRIVAYGFVVYVLLVNFMLHDFWTMSQDVVEHETQNFVKNLGILAGLMVLAGASNARPISLTGWWQSDKSLLAKSSS